MQPVPNRPQAFLSLAGRMAAINPPQPLDYTVNMIAGGPDSSDFHLVGPRGGLGGEGAVTPDGKSGQSRPHVRAIAARAPLHGAPCRATLDRFRALDYESERS